MNVASGTVLLSPSDLTAYLACEHLTTLDLRVARGELAKSEPSEDAQLLFAKGNAHEAAYLERLRADGLNVREISIDGGYEAAAQATGEAIRGGVDVIYQAVFTDGRWRGLADFLMRVDVPSTVGGWSYEALDTKLARSAKPAYILQLCFYSEQLALALGQRPGEVPRLLGYPGAVRVLGQAGEVDAAA